MLWESKTSQTKHGIMCGSSLLLSWLTDDQEAHSASCWRLGKVQAEGNSRGLHTGRGKLNILLGCVCLSYINEKGEEDKCTEQVKTCTTSIINSKQRHGIVSWSRFQLPGKRHSFSPGCNDEHSVHHICSHYTWLRFVLRAGYKKAKSSNTIVASSYHNPPTRTQST